MINRLIKMFILPEGNLACTYFSVTTFRITWGLKYMKPLYLKDNLKLFLSSFSLLFLGLKKKTHQNKFTNLLYGPVN